MITLTGISASVVGEDGGTQLILSGNFAGTFDKTYNIHIGPTTTVADPKAQSGVPGQGSLLYISTPTKIVLYTPQLPVGGPYDVLLRRTDGFDSGTLPAAITVLPRQYYGGVYEYRSVFPPYYRIGPRSIELEVPT